MRVVTLGEIMLRLTPPGVLRLGQAESFEVQYGGAEANVAVALANFGEETSFVSAVPANAVGQAAIDSLRRRGVDTRFVLRGGSRLGIYFLERGVSQRAGGVVYDRADSAFACSEASQYDWEAIFRGADWLHFTGITPALGERAEEVVRQACAAAKKAGATISCDLNFRNKLWDKERAGAVMGELLSFADVCIANEHQVAELFGAKEEDAAAYLADRYPFRAIALSKRRTISATVNVVGGSLYREGKKAASREYQVEMAGTDRRRRRLCRRSDIRPAQAFRAAENGGVCGRMLLPEAYRRGRLLPLFRQGSGRPCGRKEFVRRAPLRARRIKSAAKFCRDDAPDMMRCGK